MTGADAGAPAGADGGRQQDTTADGRWRHPVPPDVAEFVGRPDGLTGMLETVWSAPVVPHPQGRSAS